jgi:predicted RNA-binding protein YlxR (DUF448 family)
MPNTRKIPTRTCVACRRARPKREMVRVVRTPTGEVKVDRTGKLSGRGAYVCPEPDCVEVGVGQQRLQHALEVQIPEEVAQALHGLAHASA